MAARLVYVTTKDKTEARQIARAAVEAKLAACANILDGMSSVYRWQGNIVEDQEVVLILKTREESVDALMACIKGIHSYECPCIVSLPIERGHQDYIAWIEANSSPR